MQSVVQMPIFPLPAVALPSEVIPLHIFEPRYKEMIRWCVRQQAEGQNGDFVILRHHDGATAPVGCAVRIRRVLREYEDGRFDLLTEGRSRWRVRERLQVQAYDCAMLEPFEDEESDWDEALATQAYQLHCALIRLAAGAVPPDEAYNGRRALSFFLAQSAAMCPSSKQRFLELRRENDRLDSLAVHLRRMIARVEENQVIAQAVQGQWQLQEFIRRGSA
jgi:Lon protease-like protein